VAVILGVPGRHLSNHQSRSTGEWAERTRIVISSNTKLVCATIILVTGMLSSVYLATTDNNDPTAIGLIGTIVVSVLAGTFGLVRLDRIEQKVDRVGRQTNGDLHAAVEQIMEQRLTASGQPPLRGQSLEERDATSA